MFTGIIEAVGRIAALQAQGRDLRMRVQAGKLGLTDVAIGDSIATNGVCLTVTALPGDGFWTDVSGESLAHTTLGRLRVGGPVNLEKALTPNTRLGGHLVSGHVDGVGKVLGRRSDGRSEHLQIAAPEELSRYIARKGSICVDGISLTVNAVQAGSFALNIVPHTLRGTTLADIAAGDEVNLEVDLIARYLERLLLGNKADKESQGISLEFLGRHGFLRGG